MTTPRPKPEDRDRAMADAAAREMAAALFRVAAATEPDAFTIEPIFPGSTLTERRPAPVPALRAALLLARLLTGEARRQVRRAREAGLSWAELAPAVDAEDAASAYEWSAGPTSARWDARSVVWRCPTCGQLVTDRGPSDGHPDDEERGHSHVRPRPTAVRRLWLWQRRSEEQRLWLWFFGRSEERQRAKG